MINRSVTLSSEPAVQLVLRPVIEGVITVLSVGSRITCGREGLSTALVAGLRVQRERDKSRPS